MKIFITGTTGFIGSNFVKQLLPHLAPDATVSCLVRKNIDLIDSRVKLLSGDLEHIEAYKDELREADYVFHLGGIATFGNDAAYQKVNYEPTQKMVDILADSPKIRNFIFLSTIGAMDRGKDDDCSRPLNTESQPSPTSEYGRQKYRAEQYITQSRLPYTIIRPTWVYGEGMRRNSHINVFVSMLDEKPLLAHIGFPGKVSLIYVGDLSRALMNCLDNQAVIGKTYFGVTECLSLGNIFAIIYEKLYKTKPFQVALPRFSFILSQVHRHIPLTLANLFLDYLRAEDDRFIRDFRLEDIKDFAQQVQEVIDNNINLAGCWVITGANSGIGLELARKLKSHGRKLILIDRRTDRLQNFEQSIVYQADLASFEEVEKTARLLESHRIYCLVNNAGVGFRRSIHNISLEEISLTINVNCLAPVWLTKLLLPNLVENGSIIVNVASNIAFNPLPYMSLYSSSKAMLLNWSESLTYELKDTNTVVTFAPSGTKTNFQVRAGVKVLSDGKGLASAEYVAGQIIRAVKARKKIVILGFGTKLLLLFAKFLPRSLNIVFWGKLFEKLR